MALRLTNADGDEGIVQQGESCNITGQLDNGSGSINKAALATLTLLLYDQASGYIINSWKGASDSVGKNILDANGCSVDSGGAITIELNAADNPIVGTSLGVGGRETHVARVEWTWSDGNTTRTGREELLFWVEKIASPATPS